MAARDLTVRQMAKVVQQREAEITDPPDLGPDQMRLYNYYKPGLVAGDYIITATQSISSPANWGQQDLVVKNSQVGDPSGRDAPQQFEVVVPRFSLDADLINSYYPPDGHQDEGRILPHIVFNDPHFPWEILAGSSDSLKGPIDAKDYTYVDTQQKSTETQKVYRNLVPWVALVVFDPEELRFDNVTDLSNLGLSGYSTDEDLQKQDPKGLFTMQVKDYFQLPASSRVNHKAGYSDDDVGKKAFANLQGMTSSMDVIFPTKSLFKALFDGIENVTSTLPDGTVTSKSMSTIEAHKYMSHVRHINTIGFPDAGVEEDGLFSIVVSSRTGKIDIQQPHTQICHLVSIEHVDATLGPWLTQTTTPSSDRIGLVSLFSWIYTALPPNPINFVDTVRRLVTSQQMLKVDKTVLDNMDTSTEGSDIIAERLKQGYTLSRWRTQSGEETAAFNRGPLVPGPVPSPIALDIPDCSTSSQDYQILDSQTGLIDLSYSSAWQLGKLLAISDTTFSSALMRFRSIVHNSSILQAQMEVSSMGSKTASIAKMVTIMDNLSRISAGSTGDPERFRPLLGRSFAPNLQDPDLKPLIQANLQDAVNLNASAGQEIYNEFNQEQGNNSDWAIIHAWLCEKLSLGGIPPQYLLPEPAFLPPESLRFFHIDDFWLDCFIDGALSIANHLESDDDVTRRRIKQTFNIYLESIVPRAGYKPQIPCYGFLIRSNLIKVMPDLRITVTWKKLSGAGDDDDQRAPVCRWTKWDDETLMALLDRQPEELDKVVLAQPPHQQRFSLGSYVKKGTGTSSGDNDLVEFELRRLYTSAEYPKDSEWPQKPWPDGTSNWSGKPTSWLNFDTRVLNLGQMAKDINSALQFDVNPAGEAYNDLIPNSCELGLELNDPSYYFTITPPPPNSFQPTQDTQRKRTLYVNPTPRVSVAEAAKTASKALSTRSPSADSGQHPLKTTAIAPKSQAQSPVASAAPLTPAPIQKPPNSQTKLQPGPFTRLASNFQPIAGALTTAKQFQLKVYPDYKGTPTRYTSDKFDINDYIPSLNIYLFDLIFSIQKPTNSDQALLRIDIDIPMRTNPPDTKKEALLDSNYYGPGLRMLSNQRFIPFLYYNEAKQPGSTADNLHIELIPRSADDGVTIKLNDKKTAEISFRLAEAPISKLEVLTNVNVDGNQATRGRVEIKMTEWYKTKAYPLGEPATSTYVLLKRAVTDDKNWGI